jgi:hypothetical protein
MSATEEDDDVLLSDEEGQALRGEEDDDIDMDYVPDLLFLEPLPFDDTSLARQFEAGLDTMESWQEYTSALEERKQALQLALKVAAENEEDERKEKGRRKEEARKRKKQEQKAAAENHALNSIQDDSAEEAQSSSSEDQQGLSGSSSTNEKDDEYEIESGLPSDNEIGLDETGLDDLQSDSALDAEIEAEENHLR